MHDISFYSTRKYHSFVELNVNIEAQGCILGPSVSITITLKVIGYDPSQGPKIFSEM